MDAATQQVNAQAILAHTDHSRNKKAAALLGALMAVLLWQTRWPSLRAGLVVLVMGQLVVVAMLTRRNWAIAKSLEGLRKENGPGADLLGWFDQEESFAKRLTLIENAIRLVGFLMLAYGFWYATGSIAVAVLLGIFYPVIAYFGIVRKKHLRNISKLKAQRSHLQKTLLSKERH